MKKTILVSALCGMIFCGITAFAEQPEVKYDCINRTVDVLYQAQESGTITFKMEYTETNRISGLFEKVTDEENKAEFNIVLPQSAPYGDYLITVCDNGSGEMYEEHFTHRKPSSDCDITSFSIKGQKAVISGTGITLTLPYGTDLKTLVPVFETEGTVYIDTAVQTSGISIVNFTDTQIYKVVAEDGTEKTYYVKVGVEPKKQSGGSGSGGSSGGSGGGGGSSSVSSGGSLSSIITYTPPSQKPEAIEQQPDSEGNNQQYTVSDFIDVSQSHWAYPVIMKLKSAGIIEGVDDQRYEPERSVTYAEFLKLLVSVADLSDSSLEIDALKGYENEWYYEYAKKALSHHIQIDNEPFNEPLTREKMAQLLYLTIQVKGITLDQDMEISFLDKDSINGQYLEAVEVLSTSDVLHGDENGNFRPQDSLSRAEAAVVISYLNEEVAK